MTGWRSVDSTDCPYSHRRKPHAYSPSAVLMMYSWICHGN